MNEDRYLDIYDIRIANVTMDEALARIFDAIQRYASYSSAQEMHFVNAHCINVAGKNLEYRNVLKHAHAVFADGTGIRKAGALLGTPIVDNVNGTDMFPLLCKECAQRGLKMYLLGAAPTIAHKVAQWADSFTNSSIIAGVHDGFFGPHEIDKLIQEITDAHPDILLVAMGVPKQELWIHEHLDKLHVPVCMGVGGLFDFYSGTIPRAPLWMRNIGCEWVWRLLKEPKRMWKRYIIGNVVFMSRMYKLKRERKRSAAL